MKHLDDLMGMAKDINDTDMLNTVQKNRDPLSKDTRMGFIR
jgi:hypothetical protein